MGLLRKKFEYSVLAGYRFIKDAGGTGITIDAFIGVGLGYRDFDRDYPAVEEFEQVFDDLDTDKLSVPFRFGVNIGYMLEAR